MFLKWSGFRIITRRSHRDSIPFSVHGDALGSFVGRAVGYLHIYHLLSWQDTSVVIKKNTYQESHPRVTRSLYCLPIAWCTIVSYPLSFIRTINIHMAIHEEWICIKIGPMTRYSLKQCCFLTQLYMRVTMYSHLKTLDI